MPAQALKNKAAQAALAFVGDHRVIGVGTGSTVDYFIQALASIKARLDGCVASSRATADRLRAFGIPVLDLNGVDEVPLYVDGADEVNSARAMIKGGGGALTSEKIIASAAKEVICIVDASKFVPRLGAFPVAVEVIPMARSFVARKILALGGDPVYREGFVTDHGNVILDVYNLVLAERPEGVESALNNIPGVVENGLFAQRLADRVLVAYPDRVGEF